MSNGENEVSDSELIVSGCEVIVSGCETSLRIAKSSFRIGSVLNGETSVPEHEVNVSEWIPTDFSDNVINSS